MNIIFLEAQMLQLCAIIKTIHYDIIQNNKRIKSITTNCFI